MSFSSAIRVLNNLKRRRVIRDYTLIGAVAATAYMEPLSTEDLDIIILVDTDDEYLQTFRRISSFAEGIEGMHYILGGVPVQIFPTTTKPLYRDTVENARRARIGNLRVKVASPEHLVVLGLEAFRHRDRLRILVLLEASNLGTLNQLLRQFDDDEETLAHRLQKIRRISLS